MTQPTLQEIQATQGTRLSDKAPWETYDDEMTEKLNPQLAAAVAEYAERVHDHKPSNQSLEELHRQKEINTELAEQYQFVKPEEYAYIAPRIGTVLHPHTLLNKLRKIGIKSWYREHPHPDKAVLLVQRRPGLPIEVACWVQYGLMPEYSILGFDDYGVPLSERRRGWRTVLLQLALKEMITETQINKTFGEAQGPASRRFLSTLYMFRNRGSKWAE